MGFNQARVLVCYSESLVRKNSKPFGQHNLTHIFESLESNMFSGTVPAELGKLANLQSLVLSANNLSGELPTDLNNLSNLTELRLSGNNFTGKIPSLDSWSQLEELEIEASGFEGPVSASLSNLNKMKELRISDISGEGSQFPDLSSMSAMTKLMLSRCNITGTINRDNLSHMSELKHLDLSFNKLTGDMPDLSGLTKLEKIFMTGNSLNGSFPQWISDKVGTLYVFRAL